MPIILLSLFLSLLWLLLHVSCRCCGWWRFYCYRGARNYCYSTLLGFDESDARHGCSNYLPANNTPASRKGRWPWRGNPLFPMSGRVWGCGGGGGGFQSRSLYIHIQIHMRLHVHTYRYSYVIMSINVYMYLHIYTHEHMCTCRSIHVYMYMYICIWYPGKPTSCGSFRVQGQDSPTFCNSISNMV